MLKAETMKIIKNFHLQLEKFPKFNYFHFKLLNNIQQMELIQIVQN